MINRIHPHWISVFDFDSRGWYSESHAHKMYNTHTVGVYAHCYQEHCPAQNMMPWELETTFYIGKSGGTVHEWRGDDKRGGGFKTFKKSSVYDRFQAHTKMYHKEGDAIQLLEQKYQDFHTMKKNNPPHWQVWYTLLAPSPSLPKSVLQDLRAEVSLVECECIYLYKSRWGSAPLMNREHRNDYSPIQANSVSSLFVTHIGDITSWMN